jgi:replicative DNA helicase
MTDNTQVVSEESERAVIGMCMYGYDDINYLEAASIVTSKDFFYIRHALIWQAIETVYGTHRQIDTALVALQLENTKQLDEIGGRSYLIQLVAEAPVAHVAVYAEMVHRLAKRRNALSTVDQIRGLLLDSAIDTEAAFNQADNLWMRASGEVQDSRGAWLRDVASTFFDDFEKRMLNNDRFSGIETGLQPLDEMINGLEDGRLHILCGRPGMGKSTVADTIVLNSALRGIPVMHATSERPKKQVFQRWLSILTGLSYKQISNAATLTMHERAAVTRAIGDLSELPIYMYDVAMPSITALHRQAQFLQDRHNVRLLVLDGMYRCSTGDSKLDREDYLRYSFVAQGGKTIAVDLGMPVLFTHQLNRSLEDRADKRPRLDDLRGSGRIEEEADIVLGVYRDSEYDQTADPHALEVLGLKNRDAQKTVAHLYYDGACSRITNGHYQTTDFAHPF